MNEEWKKGRMEVGKAKRRREQQRWTKGREGKQCAWLCVCVSVWRDSRAAMGKQKSTEMGVERERKGENKYIKMNRERAKMRERQKEIERDIEMCVGRLAGERLEREREGSSAWAAQATQCACV